MGPCSTLAATPSTSRRPATRPRASAERRSVPEVAPIGAGRHAEPAAARTAEVGGILVAERVGDVGNRKRGLAQQPLRLGSQMGLAQAAVARAAFQEAA